MRCTKDGLATVHIGGGSLTRDLVWCQCGRGLSLTGKWLYCPSCGSAIDQVSYREAVALAENNDRTHGLRHSVADPDNYAEIQRLRKALEKIRDYEHEGMDGDYILGTLRGWAAEALKS